MALRTGHGGRSTACQTCRRRRLKCDLKEPECERCLKAHIKCGGYTKDLKFVDEKKRAQKRVQIKRQEYLQSVQADAEKVQNKRTGTLVRRRSSQGSPSPAIPEISMAGFLQHIQVTHMDENFFAGVKATAPWNMDWYTGRDDCTTTQTIRALGSMYYGRMHKHQESLAQSMVYYGKALRLLAVDISSPTSIYKVTSVTNVVSLCIFEMMASSSGAGLIGHQSGLERLMHAWQPERFQKLPARLILDHCRLALCYVHTDMRKRCLFDQKEWLEVPWADDPSSKPLFSRICDRISILPGLLEDMETLFSTKAPTSPGSAEMLLEKIKSELKELYIWRSSWEKSHGACCNAKKVEDPNVPFTTVLCFNDLQQGYEIALYDAILLTLFRMGRILQGPVFVPPPPAMGSPSRANIALLRPSDQKTLQDIAREILRIAEFSMSGPSPSAGCFQMIWPLRVAMEVFKQGTREWTYLGKCFEDIADKGGFEMSRSIMPSGLRGRMLCDEWINT